MGSRTVRTKYLFFAVAAFAIALLSLVAMKMAVYSSCILENAASASASVAPAHSFTIGSIHWDVDAFAQDPQLETLRQFFQQRCSGKTGVQAAICVSEAFAVAFPMGSPQKDFYDRHYDVLEDFRVHMSGQPGHCVNRSGLLAAVLLSAGIPARVVAVLPLKGRGGHTLVEVWDGAKWQLVDPSANGLVWSRDGTTALAMTASKRPISFLDPLKGFESRPYSYQSSLVGGEVVLPEPWLYTRTGERFSFWPFRGRFVQVGMLHGHFKTPLLITRLAFILASVLGAFCLGLAFLGRGLSQEVAKAQQHDSWSAAWKELVCPRCAHELSYRNTARESLLACLACHAQFPIIHGIPRFLLQQHAHSTEAEARTAAGFGFEWSHFSEMYPEWEQNFLDYMAPHDRSFFQGKKVLDAGCGIGRHAYYAAKYGAEVCAVDASQAAEIAARNTSGLNVKVAQADLNHLPFAPQSFDLVYSIGVLHHLSDPEAALRYLLRFLKPDGEIRVFLYWAPEGQPIKRILLDTVSVVRRLTTRLPHRVLYPLSYVAAAVAWVCFVWPYHVLRVMPGCRRIAERLPMKQYVHYPFRTCVNDQFDRFSTPIERRYTRGEVEELFRHVGRQGVTIRQNFGWVASSREAA